MSENAQERVIKDDSSTGHAQFEFSQKYSNRNDHVLNICMSMIRPTPSQVCFQEGNKSSPWNMQIYSCK